MVLRVWNKENTLLLSSLSYSEGIDPIHKGVSLFLWYRNMSKMNSLHHGKEQISNFLQFESHSSRCFKVRAISDLRDLYGNKIQGLTSLAFKKSQYNVETVQKY